MQQIPVKVTATIGSTILAPCLRDGKEGDWWGNQHEHCTGFHSIDGYSQVKCDCECHKTPAPALGISMTFPSIHLRSDAGKGVCGADRVTTTERIENVTCLDCLRSFIANLNLDWPASPSSTTH